MKLPVPNCIDFLVYRKFPELRPPLTQLAKQQLRNNGVEVDETPYTTPSEDIKKNGEAYRLQLSKLSKEELTSKYKEELQKSYIESDKRSFFNQPESKPDYDYWSKMADWTLDEAIALSLDKEPRVVNWNRLKSILSYPSPFVKQYSELRELTSRAIKWQKLYDPVLPGIFLGWVKQNDISFPKELEEKIIAKGNHILNWKELYETQLEKSKEYIEMAEKVAQQRDKLLEQIKNTKIEEKELHPRERNSALQIILGMAVGGYGYIPSSSRSPTAKEISDDLIEIGLSIDEDTVRKYLKEAKDLFSNQIDINKDT